MRNIDEYKETGDRRIYKRLHYERVLGCTRCPPHRNENGHWRKPRKKKEYQLKNINRRRIRHYG